MNWKTSHNGYIAQPYEAILRQGTWRAVVHTGKSFPVHIKTCKTRAEAIQACEEYHAKVSA